MVKKVLKKVRKILRKMVIKNPVYIPMIEGNILKGKTILLTGASGGIGSAIARQCVKNGASVILAGRNKAKLENVANECLKEMKDANQYVTTWNFDIELVSTMEEEYYSLLRNNDIKRVDVLINNAGLQKGVAIGNTLEGDFDKTLNTNLK